MKARNLDRILDVLPKECENDCGRVFIRNEENKHQQICEFRKIRSLFANTNTEMTFIDLFLFI